MKVLVIGGSGHVGRLVLPALAARHDLRVLDLRPPDTAAAHEYVAGDATDPAALAAACAGMDAVLHMAMAPITGPEGADPSVSFDVHVKSAWLAAEAAADAGVPHLVHISSMSVFPQVERLPIEPVGPDTAPDSVDLYGLTKRLGEQAVRAAATARGLSLVILRLSFPTSDADWPAWKIAGRPPRRITVADGRPVPGLAASDLAAAMLAALEHRDGQHTYPVAGDTEGIAMDLTPTREGLGWWPAFRPDAD